MRNNREESSFRDPNGFIFYQNGQVYRVVQQIYQNSFDQLNASGLYAKLLAEGLLVRHEEVPENSWPELPAGNGRHGIYKVLRAEKVPFISYPYEWCFTQLKDAALLTLKIQQIALDHGMTLKDASAFNVQFIKGRPVFIDTLSFEPYTEGKPWVAYRQFCTHFLAPLCLMSRVSPLLHRMNALHIDGIPLSLASALLPFKTKFSPFYQMHIHFHAKLEQKYSGNQQASGKIKYNLSRTKLDAILQHLQSGVAGLTLPVSKTEWSDYYQEFSYSDTAIEHKKELVKAWTAQVQPQITWDLGCNTGLFSKLVQPLSGEVVAFDIDHLAIEKFYQTLAGGNEGSILPLVMDLNNPTPGIGWGNKERRSFMERGQADLILALALVHHLSIGNNIPLQEVAAVFQKLAQTLIIEFVPKSDPQSQRLLVTREDIFTGYHEQGFQEAFSAYFTIREKQMVQGTERILYLMERK